MQNLKPDRKKFRQETIIHSYILRPLALEIVRLVWDTPITANQITLFRIFLNIIALFLFATGNPLLFYIGLGLFVFHEVLDHADGMLARYKNQLSSHGAKLELFGDILFSNTTSLLGIFITYGIYVFSSDADSILYFAILASVSATTSSFVPLTINKIETLHVNHDIEKYLDLNIMNPKQFFINLAKTAYKFRNYIVLIGAFLNYNFLNIGDSSYFKISIIIYLILELIRLFKTIRQLFLRVT